MKKQIITATEIITVNDENVIEVTPAPICMPYNFSFANIGKDIISTAPVKHTAHVYQLFVDDFVKARGAFDELYAIAWTDYGRTCIIC